jgi:hypothetical protein
LAIEVNLEKIYQHLTEYKRNVLGITENGIWKKNKEKYPHILPEEHKERNLIQSTYYEGLLKLTVDSSIKLHPDFHHLNSSQALCFNLFVPMKEKKIFQPLFDLLSIKDEVEFTRFEYISDPEENTNFDYFIEGENTKYFFEIKYTEAKFGSAANDDRHQKKYNNIYKERLEKITSISMETFFRDYQLWRNLIYSDQGIVVFVIPKFREDLLEKINDAKSKMKNDNNVKILRIENICKKYQQVEIEEITSHYSEFYKKYFEI